MAVVLASIEAATLFCVVASWPGIRTYYMSVHVPQHVLRYVTRQRHVTLKLFMA
jgi:hypothetical protein